MFVAKVFSTCLNTLQESVPGKAVITKRASVSEQEVCIT